MKFDVLMEIPIRSIRSFIGAKDYTLCRRFYTDWGFKESQIDQGMSYFFKGPYGFYLQDYYVKDWIDNSMFFMEVMDVEQFWTELVATELDQKYPIRLTGIKQYDWGKECFLHDPSGVLWHIGQFNNK